VTRWSEPDGYSPSKDEFDQLDDYASRWKMTVIALLAVALIIAGVSAWRYVADCTQHFGTLDCARAWAGWTD
jgi:hypothetical protein